jgi:hypothetical protein
MLEPGAILYAFAQVRSRNLLRLNLALNDVYPAGTGAIRVRTLWATSRSGRA